ncbi:MAG: hypothetical protein ACLQO7_02940 [Candidatus Bathyarchaeia archaeon]
MLLITACATIIGGFIVTAHANNANSTTSSTTSSTNAIASEINATNPQQLGMNGMNNGNQGFGGPMGQNGNMGQSMSGPMGTGDNMNGFMGSMSGFEVSSAYTANVTAILDSDTNVAKLISEGYNVTSINPIIQNVINGDGTITMQATTAIVTLQDGTSGYATAHVDLTSGTVTKIVIITRTEIDNTTTSTTNSTNTTS